MNGVYESEDLHVFAGMDFGGFLSDVYYILNVLLF